MKPDKASQCAEEIWASVFSFHGIRSVEEIIRKFYPEESPDAVKITLDKPQPDPTKGEGSGLSFID